MRAAGPEIAATRISFEFQSEASCTHVGIETCVSRYRGAIPFRDGELPVTVLIDKNPS